MKPGKYRYNSKITVEFDKLGYVEAYRSGRRPVGKELYLNVLEWIEDQGKKWKTRRKGIKR